MVLYQTLLVDIGVYGQETCGSSGSWWTHVVSGVGFFMVKSHSIVI